MMRVYRLVNEPWIHVPRWLRARRVSKIASKRMEAAHVEWARKLREKSVI
jgi:hypothetical protein